MRALRDDACGCATGAVFMAVGLGLSAAYFGWQCWMGDLTAAAAAWRVALVTFLAAGGGKVLGILRHRLGRHRSAARTLHSNLAPRPTGD